MEKLAESFNNDLDSLEAEVFNYFNELLKKKKEFVIVDEDTDELTDYLEVRNDITGNVFDVHPIMVTELGIYVVEADGSDTRHTLKLSDLSSVQDRINLVELMENLL